MAILRVRVVPERERGEEVRSEREEERKEKRCEERMKGVWFWVVCCFGVFFLFLANCEILASKFIFFWRPQLKGGCEVVGVRVLD